MRCRKCGEKAVINMRQHRLSLCSQHYLEWLPNQVQRFIEKYRMFNLDDRVLVAVSGGKDSLALWDVLHNLGYQTERIYIDLGIDEGIAYSHDSRKAAKKFSDKCKRPLHVIDIQSNYGESIPEISQRTHRGRKKPCSMCGLVKRHILNEFATQGKFDVLVTGHNLDDEAAILFANTLDWSLEFLARGYPLLMEKPGFARKAKPFCRIYERESAAYAILRKIDYVNNECPFSIDSKQLYNKKILNEWEDEQPGIKLRFYLHYLKALEKGAFPQAHGQDIEITKQLCPKCGQPTNTGGLCAFCRLFEE
jgi:tRNA-5-methyluridine54 2-sulfurtransferase